MKCPSRSRLILTGTPIQNDVAELWSLLHFLMPNIFKNLETFSSLFDKEEFNVRDLIRTYLFRCTILTVDVVSR